MKETTLETADELEFLFILEFKCMIFHFYEYMWLKSLFLQIWQVLVTYLASYPEKKLADYSVPINRPETDLLVPCVRGQVVLAAAIALLSVEGKR